MFGRMSGLVFRADQLHVRKTAVLFIVGDTDHPVERIHENDLRPEGTNLFRLHERVGHDDDHVSRLHQPRSRTVQTTTPLFRSPAMA